MESNELGELLDMEKCCSWWLVEEKKQNKKRVQSELFSEFEHNSNQLTRVSSRKPHSSIHELNDRESLRRKELAAKRLEVAHRKLEEGSRACL